MFENADRKDGEKPVPSRHRAESSASHPGADRGLRFQAPSEGPRRVADDRSGWMIRSLFRTDAQDACHSPEPGEPHRSWRYVEYDMISGHRRAHLGLHAVLLNLPQLSQADLTTRPQILPDLRAADSERGQFPAVPCNRTLEQSEGSSHNLPPTLLSFLSWPISVFITSFTSPHEKKYTAQILLSTR